MVKKYYQNLKNDLRFSQSTLRHCSIKIRTNCASFNIELLRDFPQTDKIALSDMINNLNTKLYSIFDKIQNKFALLGAQFFAYFLPPRCKRVYVLDVHFLRKRDKEAKTLCKTGKRYIIKMRRRRKGRTHFRSNSSSVLWYSAKNYYEEIFFFFFVRA